MSGLNALLGLYKPEYKFDFHDDDTLHDTTPDSQKWGARDTVAALRMIGPAIQNGPEQAARGALPTLDVNDKLSKLLTKGLVSKLWGSMLHPPLSYLGNEQRYRTADGSFNNIHFPDLGKAGLPYAKSVQGRRAMHGAKPDPGDLFDLLMARPDDKPLESETGISSMLLYHATLIIHDIFRTDDVDKNISDSSSYLDLTPLYGNCVEAQMAVRSMKDGLLKPDTFAEHRLLNQPPGVTCYLIMYNRFHNYVATQLKAIDESSRFSLPSGSIWDKLTPEQKDAARVKQDEDLFQTARLVTCGMYIQIAVHDYLRCLMKMHAHDTAWTLDPRLAYEGVNDKHGMARGEGNMVSAEFNVLYRFHSPISERDAAWSRDAFEVWMRMTGKVKPDNQVTPEQIANGEFLTETMVKEGNIPVPFMRMAIDGEAAKVKKSWNEKSAEAAFPQQFGGRWSRDQNGNMEMNGPYPKVGGRFKRGADGKFDDAMLVEELVRTIEDPINQFGAQNIPKIFRSVEILGILQARKWELATLNEFRQFFGMSRHTHFEDVNSDVNIQQALRDMYEDPDMIELYPGLMCEGKGRCLDPGTTCPGEESTSLWRAVFSDAVTLVRSDRFYTIDWNVDSLTSWGFKEVSSDPKINKGSVFHRLFQRAFPGYFDYNSIHMWQPFYTPAKNLQLAEEQGYLDFLNIKNLEYKVDANTWQPLNRSNPSKVGYVKSFSSADYATRLSRRIRRNLTDSSKKTLQTFDNHAAIKSVLAEPKDSKNKLIWVNPGVAVSEDIPAGPLREIITNTWPKWDAALATFNRIVAKHPGHEQIFMDYFVQMSREIRVREQRKLQKVKMAKNQPEAQVYQIDVVKDFTIPVVTKFFVDFLGCWDQVKTEGHVDRPYTENQIYQHIDNCQNFQSWDSDETKVWQRRVAFKESMVFLKQFAEEGIAKSDNTIYGYASSIKRFLSGDRSTDSYVAKIREVAVHTITALKHSGLSQKEVAAVMLSFALDMMHKLVLTFSEMLAYFIDPQSHANSSVDPADCDPQTQRWAELQTLALANTPTADAKITKYVVEAHRLSYKLKLCRKYNSSEPAPAALSLSRPVHSNDMVLLDIYTACQDPTVFPDPAAFRLDRPDSSYLILGDATFTKQLSVVALAGMLKHTAQLAYLRVAHDKLGRLKRVATPDGYVRYASPQWDRLLPFPTSWNLRFNGEGAGVYAGGDNADQGHGLDQVYRPLQPVKRAKIEEVNSDSVVPAGDVTNTGSLNLKPASKVELGPRVTTTEIFH